MLSYTRDQLQQPLRDILHELKELINPDNNYLNYHKALGDMEMDMNECIPWLSKSFFFSYGHSILTSAFFFFLSRASQRLEPCLGKTPGHT